MKKIISMGLILTMLFAMAIPVSAVNLGKKDVWTENEGLFVNQYSGQVNANVEIKKESEKMIHKISFPTISQIVDATADALNADEVDEFITEQGYKNVQFIREYINGLDMTEQEKNIHLEEIDKITDGYIDGYKIYTTSANDVDYTYYGVYSGMYFYQRPSADISVNYKKETERNISNLNKWISMAADLVLTIEEMAPVSMAVTVLNIGKRMYSDNYTAKSGDYTEYYVRTVRRIREIGIIDAWGDFRAVMVDNKVDMYPYSIYHFADPSIYKCSAAVTEYMDEWRTVYSQYYNNRSYNLKAAYEQYTVRPDIILYMQGAAVNSSMFTWELK